MKMKQIRGIITVVLLIAIAVCVLPLPERVNVTLPCVEATLDGAVKDDITLHVEGWYLKCLLRPDVMKASVQIQETGRDTVTSMKIDGHVPDTSGANKWCSAPFYDAHTDSFEPVTLAFSDTMDAFVLTRYGSESFYAAASDVRENLPEILERFRFIIH